MIDEFGREPGKKVLMDVSKSGLPGAAACAGCTPVVRDSPAVVIIAESGAMMRASLADNTLSDEISSLNAASTVLGVDCDGAKVKPLMARKAEKNKLSVAILLYIVV